MNKAAKSPTKPGRTRPVATDQVMFSLLAAAHGVEQRMETAMEEVGLSSAVLGAHAPRTGEALSLSECAKRMTCVRSNITQLMDRLEAEGLVRRVDDPNDRRGVQAAVTPLGIERQAAGAKQLARVQKEFGNTLAESDCEALARMLAAMR
jgi:DNA-binding MarR family transcriptional regulator